MQITHGRDLTGKIAIITGANSGIGFETARSLALRGCNVVFACRDIKAAEEAIAALKKESPQCTCRALHLDLASLKSVKAFAQNFVLEFRCCDILILNAGVFGLPYALTEDSFETTFQVNFLSQFYLALLVQPLMTSSTLARVVFVSAESHRFGSLASSKNLKDALCVPESQYLSTVAYNNSKLCSILGCFELHRRFADFGLKCYAVHPGNLVRTNLSRHWWVYKALFAAVQPFAKSVKQACGCSVYCAVSPDIANCSGMYVNNCTPCLPSPEAMSPILANKLWITSLEIIEQRLGKKAFFLE
ncbi:UNVERIFIED_CONTAM: hypothetical protein GTU68_053125 [Idotea baltica]|nr:hypothetical protein [Idotea baltica]